MQIEVTRVDVQEVQPLRELYRQRMNCQIISDSFPRRGFSDAYLIRVAGRSAGYGLVANRHDPDTVHEFYTLPEHEAAALPLFRELLAVSQATKIRVQTNDGLLLLMLYDCATAITSQTILFADRFPTQLPCPAGVLRKTTEADQPAMFEHQHEPVGDWLIERDGVVVATGGALFHYNPPYGDLYMEVHPAYRRHGYGAYLVQELKRICYEMGKCPAARCNVANVASRKTLQKAGLLPCGRLLIGEVAR